MPWQKCFHIFSPLSVKITLSGGNNMNYKIVEKSEFSILEKVETHSIENGDNNKTIPEFWSRSAADGTLETLNQLTTDKSLIFGVCYNNSLENSKLFDYSIAAICDDNTIVPTGFRKNTIPARTWAVFECIGAMPDAIQKLWQKIMSEFFPTSIYQPTYERDIEVYTDGDMNGDDYRSEIWIPIIKK